jgi:putative transposase
MILTCKIKHHRDFSKELEQARLVAEFAIQHRTISTKDVKHIGLKAVISNQILRKYARDRKAKTVSSVCLTIPSVGSQIKNGKLYISSLKLELDMRRPYKEIHQIEINKDYAHVAYSVEELPQFEPQSWLGIDLNVNGYGVVLSNGTKIKKYGKNIRHIKSTARKQRAKWQRLGLKKKVKASGSKERRRTRDILHKISRAVVNLAASENAGIRLENLGKIRKKHHNKQFSGSLNSWPFYQFQQMIDYKAKLLGIPVEYIAPEFSSQTCSKCGQLGTRIDKAFTCKCGHRENADANAAFNIASLKHLTSGCQSANQKGSLTPLIGENRLFQSVVA